MHRLSALGSHFEPAYTAGQAPATPAPAGGKKDSLSVVDNRTGNILMPSMIPPEFRQVIRASH